MSFCLGVVGGSGIHDIEGLHAVDKHEVSTPYGPPSAPLVTGRLGETRLVFLPRHGEGHRLAPHEINYRANICALKQAGATHLVSLSAVGSLKEQLEPGDVVAVDQFIDRTRTRASTFFEGGVVAHVAFADPVCPELRQAAAEAAERAGARVHRGGGYLCMEGPQFSTKAESLLYRSWGLSVIGMTAMPEAKLAREAELPYALLAFVTDFDCWHEEEQPVTVEAILRVLQQNAVLAKRSISELAAALPDPTTSPAHGALEHAIVTRPDAISSEARRRLAWLVPSYSR